jgi:hypothetical protein
MLSLVGVGEAAGLGAGEVATGVAGACIAGGVRRLVQAQNSEMKVIKAT